jgi:DNA invertase Pin-like site-specific DNA recombinase
MTRKPSFDVAKARELRASGLGASEIARMLGVGRDSVYRVLDSTVGAKQHN